MSTALTLYDIEENLACLIDAEGIVEDEDQRLAILDEIAQYNEAAIQKRLRNAEKELARRLPEA